MHYLFPNQTSLADKVRSCKPRAVEPRESEVLVGGTSLEPYIEAG